MQPKSAVFSVRLPLLPASENGDRSLDSVAAPAAETEKHRVLVVDDNEDAAETLCMLLELAGHVVHSAHNGQDALAACDAFAPDVVFLDIGLPGMSGYEVTRHLRADAQHCKITLVALTGWGTGEDRNRAQSAGFDHHLTKPFDLAKMEGLLKTSANP
ncbi:MAG: rcsC [Massilia sp.]|nr:rcsC [Massilia sp.]